MKHPVPKPKPQLIALPNGCRSKLIIMEYSKKQFCYYCLFCNFLGSYFISYYLDILILIGLLEILFPISYLRLLGFLWCLYTAPYKLSLADFVFE